MRQVTFLRKYLHDLTGHKYLCFVFFYFVQNKPIKYCTSCLVSREQEER